MNAISGKDLSLLLGVNSWVYFVSIILNIIKCNCNIMLSLSSGNILLGTFWHLCTSMRMLNDKRRYLMVERSI